MRSASPAPYPCDLDPGEYNLETAWWHPGHARWVACHHGCGADLEAMERCGCERCWDMLDRLTTSWAPSPPPRREPPPPMTVDVAPIRRHVRVLLAAGCTRQQLAERAGIDRTTINRLLRADVARVHVDTAAALLALPSAR